MSSEGRPRFRPLPPAAILLLAALVPAAGCSPERNPVELFVSDEAGTPVVDAILIVGQTLPALRLSRTLPPQLEYSWETAALAEAEVVIYEQTQEGLYTVHRYHENPYGPGLYLPDARATVAAATAYQLIVDLPQGGRLTARATTPGHLAVQEWVLLDLAGQDEIRTLETFATAGESVYYAEPNWITYNEGLLEGRIASGPAALGAAGMQVALFSLDYGSDYVIDPPFFDEEDFAELGRVVSSPAVDAEDGTVRLPWFSVYYQGRHKFKVFAVDSNWFDYIRSLPNAELGLGFGHNPGDDFAEPIFHVEGGIGLFASASVDSVGFYVLPAP